MLGSPQEDHGLPACLQAVDGDNGPSMFRQVPSMPPIIPTAMLAAVLSRKRLAFLKRAMPAVQKMSMKPTKIFRIWAGAYCRMPPKRSGDGSAKHEHCCLPATVAKISQAHDKTNRKACEAGDKHHGLYGHDSAVWLSRWRQRLCTNR